MTDVCIPDDLWDSDREGVVVSWLYEDGAIIDAGRLITEVMVEKVQFEIVAPMKGRLRILAAAESIVRKGDVIARIERAAEPSES